MSRTHAGIYPVYAYGWYPQWTNPFLKYGYNEPEIARYKQKYGKFPPVRTMTSLQSLDETQEERDWNEVRGEFVTEFLREAARVIHDAGQNVVVGFTSRTYNGFQPGAYTRQPVGRIDLDWKGWSDEKLVDIIRLNADNRKHGYDDWVAHSEATYRYAQQRGVKVYLECAAYAFDDLKNPPAPLPITKEKQPELYSKVLTDITRRILGSTADGIYFYDPDEEDITKTIRPAA